MYLQHFITFFTSRMFFVRAACLLIGFWGSLLASHDAVAQESTPPKPTVRVQFVSTLPEALTYYDQGFGDFIRDSKEVPVTTLSINSLAIESFMGALDNLSVQSSPASQVSRASTQEEVDRIVAGLSTRTDVDALVVLSPGSTSSERFLKGMAVMAKIGMLGITNLSIVFTMPNFAIYSTGSSKPCASLNPVRTKRIPSIYKSWSTDMASGPTENLHREMQAIVGGELPLTVREGVTRRSRDVVTCLKPASQ